MRNAVRPKTTRGRPATGRDPTITVRLPAELINSLDDIAKFFSVPRSEIVRRALERSDTLAADHKYSGRTKTAYHEAGHAVIGTVLGLKIGRVTIKPTRKTRGRVQTFRLSGSSLPEMSHPKDRPLAYQWEAYALCMMAGKQVEHFAGFPDAGDGAGRDDLQIEKLLKQWVRSEKIDGMRDRLERMTDRLVRRHYATIQQVARRLIAKETIDGCEIEEIVRRARARKSAA
jgi:hypothetical protein